ncbi:hypothetical protein [Oscillatoria acuminata]|uniref:SpoVT-AbrB domain-containing protein n=1 Tax=Oscillatoria acuminata PCC 6304 TaxID=56110 RepID=K9TES0_9CYAN|nr:hypothetical protein [Oscillatoria acuminata]AFY80903.1 hypothetical protein Oscil6304_1183 [Oscillatoria acuminata PCC 6304]
MVNSFEFKAKIRQGMIEIPPEYQQNIQEGRDVKVIILSEEKDKPRLMDQLAEKPISVQGWVKPSRDEIHEIES